MSDDKQIRVVTGIRRVIGGPYRDYAFIRKTAALEIVDGKIALVDESDWEVIPSEPYINT